MSAPTTRKATTRRASPRRRSAANGAKQPTPPAADPSNDPTSVPAEDAQPVTQVELSIDLVNELTVYLRSRPLGEVEGLYSRLRAEAVASHDTQVEARQAVAGD